MSIFTELKNLDVETQEELAAIDSGFGSTDYEAEKIADEAVEKFLNILEDSLGE